MSEKINDDKDFFKEISKYDKKRDELIKEIENKLKKEGLM